MLHSIHRSTSTKNILGIRDAENKVLAKTFKSRDEDEGESE